MKSNTERHIPPALSSVRYMNAFERAHARQRMEQAMALADWGIGAWDTARAAANRVRNLLRGGLAQLRRRTTRAASYPD